MIVERLWPANPAGNPLRNYNYLVACPETGEAPAIDPLDAEITIRTARVKGWQITQILNTHEHRDHTGGNAAVVAATGAKVIAHHKAGGKIPGIDRGVGAGDIIKVGKTIELECMDTPGHTFCHICLRSHTDQPALFCGDTLFNAGAGNVHNGGSVDALFETFTEQLNYLPDNTLVYAGHDYMANNLRFTLSREPNNRKAQELLEAAQQHDPLTAHVTTLGEEKEINTFLRLSNPEIIEQLRVEYPDLPENPSPRSVFTCLRELRNRW